MLREIQKEIQRLQMCKGRTAEIIKNTPKGKLRCAYNKGNAQFYVDGRYLPQRKKDIAIRIASGDYAKRIDKMIDRYLNLLEDLEELYMNKELEGIYRKLRKNRRELVEPLVRPIEELVQEFENIEYEGKSFDVDDVKVYYSAKGERVRSKSEKIIADELYRYGIPYKYEMPLELMGWNKAITIYPDFTIINRRTGKRWILEHLGMLDDANYYENSIYKIDLYEKNGLLLGKDLLVFHESAGIPLNTRVMSQYIEEYFI